VTPPVCHMVQQQLLLRACLDAVVSMGVGHAGGHGHQGDVRFIVQAAQGGGCRFRVVGVSGQVACADDVKALPALGKEGMGSVSHQVHMPGWRRH
jgi:hypothetical protein